MLERLKTALASRYRVEREIGAGGMATVFLATDLKHQRPVAVKVLRPELAAAVGHDRFLLEIEIAAKLQHPHILPVYDSGEADGLLYYVMPFIEGESIRDRLVRQGPLPPVEAARIAREAADALAYAHQQGIVHRDIKPANILLSQGHAVVADFGIARAISASASATGLTQAGMAVGTPSYMSPEQALGETNLDGRTDVYALGIVLYEMLSGNPPFEGTTPQAIIAQALSTKVPKLPNDALGLNNVIGRALAREPKDRFATAGDMRAALDGVPTSSTAVPAVNRRRGLIAAGVVALVASAAFAFWPREAGGDPRKSLIVFPFENKTGDAGRDYLEEAAMNLLGLAAAHWADMRVFDDERTASLLRRRNVASGGELDFEDAREMAREARVGTMILGDLRRERDSLAIEAKVYDVRSGNRLATHIVGVAWDADPRPLFDGLAARVLGTSGAPPGEAPSVITQTTNSIDAYRAYLAGTAALQRFQIDSAKELLNRAVALDSGFALAYIRLRDAEGWGTGNPEKRRMFIRQAERHSASLPPRLRALVEYHSAYEGGDFQAARRIAADLIARDSTDVEAWYQLGEAHYHHRSPDFPHPDTLGNLGHALNAFQRTLALDSGYVLAYQHILDALQGCTGGGGANAFRLCLPDSAVYGEPEQLARQYGENLPRLRAEARIRQVDVARGWIAAVPGTPRPRVALVTMLHGQRRLDEASTEIEGLERMGWGPQVGITKAMIAFERGHPGDAATIIDTTFAQLRDTLSVFSGQQNFGLPAAILAGGGGRLAEARRLNATLFRGIPVDSGGGPGGVLMSIADLAMFSDLFVKSEAGDQPGLTGASRDITSTIQRYAGRDTVRLKRLNTSWGTSAVTVFLANRDTNLLSSFLANVDTVNSSTWRVADAQLSLARGDTARARMRVDRYYRAPAETEFTGEPGVVRAFAWADLLARLGEPRMAIEAYARIDSVMARLQHPGLLVRSWAERGALYQRTGDVQQAVRYYEQYIAAWQNADGERRQLVERARHAVAALKGEVRAGGRR